MQEGFYVILVVLLLLWGLLLFLFFMLKWMAWQKRPYPKLHHLKDIFPPYVSCPRCGMPVNRSDRFCFYCGDTL